MKKTILFLTMMVTATFMFAQTATLTLPDLVFPAAQSIDVPITVDAIDSPILANQLYVQYDGAALTYTGMSFPHPNFPTSEWTYGSNGMEVGFNWLDPAFVGRSIAPGEVMAIIHFDWNGTDTYLDWGLAKHAGMGSKGETAMFDAVFAPFTLTLNNGSVTLGGGGDVWNGSVSIDWFDPNNWDDLSVPTAGDDVLIPNTAANNCYIATMPAFCAAVEVESDMVLAIDADASLDADGVVTCDGAFFMNSWPTGECASFLDGGIDPASIGFFVYFRDVKYGMKTTTDGWHYLATPVEGPTTNDFFDYYLNMWDEPTGFWQNIGGMVDCVPLAPMNLELLEGYSINFSETYGCDAINPGTGDIIELIGPFATLGTGDYSATGTFSNVGIPGETANFNLIGNPYPSYLYYEDFFFDINSVDFADAMYMWDGVNETYLTWIFGGGDANDGFIAPTQSVFFEATGPAAEWAFTNDYRYNVAYPWQKASADDILALRATGNDYENNTFIRFNENATTGFDASFDARNISVAGTAPQLYTTSEGLMFDQNSMPATDMVTLNFVAGVNGIYTIEAYEADMNYVVLEDTYTGETTDLLNNSYEFAYDVNDRDDRFVIHFAPGTEGSNMIEIYANAKDINVIIPSEINGDIVVYNVAGQEVARQTANTGRNIITMSQSDNYFVVKVIAEEMTETGKVFIK